MKITQGRVVVSERTKLIQPLERSVVQRVLVKDGDQVQAGQPLIELDPTAAVADKATAGEQLKANESELLRTRTLLAALESKTLLNKELLAPISVAPGADLAINLPPNWLPAEQRAAKDQLAAEWGDVTARLAKLASEANRRQAEITTAREVVAKLETTVPLAQQREADFKKLFVANFTPEALVCRDILLKSILTFAKDNGYATERITANAANITLDLPNFPTTSLSELRDFAQKQLSEADQRGFSLTGPSRIVIATGAGTHAPSDKDSLMFGSAGVDGLIGGAGTDDLFGGADDLLDGGAGGDWLYGGAGNDTYQLTSGELFDVITDSDGNGTITVDGVQLAGGKKAADGYWISDDKQWGYALSSNGDSTISEVSNLHDELINADCTVMQEKNLVTRSQFEIQNRINQSTNLHTHQNALSCRQSLCRTNEFLVNGNRV